PVSITYLIPGTVSEVSATLVASTIRRVLLGGKPVADPVETVGQIAARYRLRLGVGVWQVVGPGPQRHRGFRARRGRRSGCHRALLLRVPQLHRRWHLADRGRLPYRRRRLQDHLRMVLGPADDTEYQPDRCVPTLR